MSAAAASGFLVAFGAILAGGAALYANRLKSRADREAEKRRDDDARFAELRALADEYRQAHARDQSTLDAAQVRIAALEAAVTDLRKDHVECQRRLRTAEHKLKSLGA